MFLLDSLELALVIVFLAAAMASLGLQVSTADMQAQVARRGLRWRTLLANFVIVPAIGTLLARGFVDDPAMARALVLLACTPGGLSALQFTTKAKGLAAYAGGMACLLSLLSVFLSPLLLAVAMPAGDSAAGSPAWTWRALLSVVTMPAVSARAFAFLLLFLVVPLVVGMVVKANAERAAAVLAKVLSLVSVVVFVTLVVMLMAVRKAAMQQIGGRGVALLLGFVILGMLVGWLLGGPETGTRQVLASGTSMRNVALALAIAATLPDASAVLPVLVAFSALMVPPNLLLTIACLIANRRRARASQPPPPALGNTAGATSSGGGPGTP